MIKALSVSLLIAASILFTGCSNEPTAADIAQGFWDAVVANDQEQMKALSAKGTLPNPTLLDNSENSVVSVLIGDTIEDGQGTRVATTLIGKKDEQGIATELAVNTVMVKENEAWKVDAQRTIDNLLAKSINAMMMNMSENFENIGEQLSQSLSSGVQEFMKEMNKSMPEVQKGLEALKDEDAMKSIGQSLGQVFSQGIQEIMGELNQSMKQLSDELEKENQRLQQESAPAAAQEKI